MERTQGCNHIACTCGAHFCFKCGCAYSFLRQDYAMMLTRYIARATPMGICLKNPPCNSFDVGGMVENMAWGRRRAEIPPPVINQPTFPRRGIVVPPRLPPDPAPALARPYLPPYNFNTQPTLPQFNTNWQQWQPPAYWPHNYAQPCTYHPQPAYPWFPQQTTYQYQPRAPYYASYGPYTYMLR